MNLLIFSFVEILLILFFLNKKINSKLDPSLLFILITIGYFYPILFFSKIYVFKCGEYTVSLSLKEFFFIQLISFLIFRMLFFSLFKNRENKQNYFLNLRKIKFIFKLLVFYNILFILIITIKLQAKFYFITHNKTFILKSLGILEPLYHTSALLLITFIFLYKKQLWNNSSKLLILANIIFDLLLGFRYIVYWTLINFILYKRLNIKLILIFVLAGFLLLLSKVTNYFTNLQILIEILKNFNNWFFNVIMTFSEQSTISLVLNEVVKEKFQISSSYLIKVVEKFIPFTEVINFGELYKQKLFGKCAESFASGNLAILYAIWNDFKVLYLYNLTIFLGLLLVNFIKLNYITLNLLIRSYIIGVIFFYYFRGDLQADIIYLRNIIGVILTIEFLYFILKKNSNK